MAAGSRDASRGGTLKALHSIKSAASSMSAPTATATPVIISPIPTAVSSIISVSPTFSRASSFVTDWSWAWFWKVFRTASWSAQPSRRATHCPLPGLLFCFSAGSRPYSDVVYNALDSADCPGNHFGSPLEILSRHISAQRRRAITNPHINCLRP